MHAQWINGEEESHSLVVDASQRFEWRRQVATIPVKAPHDCIDEGVWQCWTRIALHIKKVVYSHIQIASMGRLKGVKSKQPRKLDNQETVAKGYRGLRGSNLKDYKDAWGVATDAVNLYSCCYSMKTSHGIRKRDAHNVNGFSCKVAVNPLEKLERTTEKLNSDERNYDCGPRDTIMSSEHPQRPQYMINGNGRRIRGFKVRVRE